ncbi:alpha/beta fold hydrolase [Niabella beijingensis]|uniref:alpha/beta fold hydrolase n=1 Tax=Niabella beijingensis TaxID=2872700 RepID=UPI001CBB89C2|nr:alpha/beta hydrolase [Niabella beijingensis]
MRPGSSQRIYNNGVNIDYSDNGTGDTVLFFIHGWGINQGYWASQVAAFSEDYRVVTIDLPGFGQSGKNRSTWTVEDYAKDVNAVISALNLKNVILIGHSMSGSIIVETAISYPQRIIGIVGVDNLKNTGLILTPQMEKEWTEAYAEIRKNFKPSVIGEGKHLFSPSTDSGIQKRVLKDMMDADPVIAVNCLENLDKYPFSKRLKQLHKPLYLINSDYHPTDTLAFRKNGIEYHLLNIGSTGHYPMLENPDMFNQLLKQAINRMTTASAKN